MAAFTPLADEKVLGTFKPEKLAFLTYFLISGIFIIIGIGVAYLGSVAASSLGLLVGLFFLGVGILGVVITLCYLNAFRYYVTDKRIIVYRKFISISTRQVQYDDISDVVVDQGLFGRIFGFGNVIPITKSGLGLGFRGTHAGVGWKFGGRGPGPIIVGGPVGGQTVPVATPGTCIYGVKNPFEIKDTIFKQQEAYAEAPYLKRIAETVAPAPGKPAGAMLFCPFCGSKLVKPGADFCSSCGKRITPESES